MAGSHGDRHRAITRRVNIFPHDLHALVFLTGQDYLRRVGRLGCDPVPFNTVAVELVPPNLDRAPEERADEAWVFACRRRSGVRVGHVMIPRMIAEDRAARRDETKLDVLITGR